MMRRRATRMVLSGAMLLLVSGLVAQDGATSLARNYRVVFDNAAFEVVRVHYDPHEELPVHDHSHYPTVYVYLSNAGPVRFMHDETPAFALTRRPVKAGWFRVSPGRREHHQVANLGPSASDFLRVELKQIPLGGIKDEFRYRDEIDLTKTRIATEYRSPEMEIRRYIAAGSGSAGVSAEPQPTLLIAFAQSLLRVNGTPDRMLQSGDVVWLPAGVKAAVLPSAAGTAHALGIRLMR